jgi:hypothetical protein
MTVDGTVLTFHCESPSETDPEKSKGLVPTSKSKNGLTSPREYSRADRVTSVG